MGRGGAPLAGGVPFAQKLGLSATPIRYLDSQRDMADELFEGHVASEMTLGEAVVRGILPAPTYITFLYSWQKELEKYRRRVNSVSRPLCARIISAYGIPAARLWSSPRDWGPSLPNILRARGES